MLLKNNNDVNIVFRDYAPGDFEKINDFWKETHLGGSERGDNAKTIEDSIRLGGKLVVMEKPQGNILIGTSWMTFDGRRVHLHHFGIKPGYQRKGYGKLLAEESLKFAREKGYQIKLEVHQTNLNAINLYKKVGFKYLGDYDVYIIRDIGR